MADDPVLDRRARIAALVVTGKRIGYGLYLVAIVAFVVALAAGPSDTTTFVVSAALVSGSVILTPAIVFGYAVRAAEREDRGEPSGH